jgi:hypothetical protein
MPDNNEARIAKLESETKALWKAVETLFLFHGRKPPNRPERMTAGIDTVERNGRGHLVVRPNK